MRALLSVSDKTGLVPFASELAALGLELIATGGTEKALREAGLPVTSVEQVTNFPECFGGRVKTMHPHITGGILYKRSDTTHVNEAEKLGVRPIDIVVVNLYPFAQTAADPSKSEAEVIEQIDVGGPTMLRSAAKNFESVTVVCDPSDYATVIEQWKAQGNTTAELRRALATKAFLHTASYDAKITDYLSGGVNTALIMTNGKELRYGENPHQWGKYYDVVQNSKFQIPNSNWRQHQGKALSYLNILDADGAWKTAQDFREPTVVMVKHANPSGIASHESIVEAFQRAYDADRLSAFGVIIALNRPCTGEIARKIIEQKMFVEVIIAPEFDEEFLELIKQKPNIRVIAMSDERLALSDTHSTKLTAYRSALGGILVQNEDNRIVTEADLTPVTSRKPTPEQTRDLLFAWSCVKHAKSNAIVFAKDRTTVGIGAGQTSRVDSTWIAAKRAGDKARGAVMASDAFFPFPDSVEEAAKHGIVAVIQPGGSIRDDEVFKKAEELGLVMVTTGVRTFWH